MVASDLTGDGLDDASGQRTALRVMEGPIAGRRALWTVDFRRTPTPRTRHLIDADFNDNDHTDMAVPVLSWEKTALHHGLPFTSPDREWSALITCSGSAFSLAGGGGLAAADFTGAWRGRSCVRHGAGTGIHVWTNVAGSGTAGGALPPASTGLARCSIAGRPTWAWVQHGPT